MEGCDEMIPMRRDVSEKQMWDVGDERKNVWDVDFPETERMGGAIQHSDNNGHIKTV